MNSKFTSRDIFYFGGLLLVTLSSSLVGQTYLFLIPNLNPFLKYGSVLFFLISLFYKRWPKGDLIKSIALTIIVFAVAVITDANILFIYILAIISSKPEDFDKICRFLFWMNLILFFTILTLCRIGVLQDEVYVHYELEAHTLGYTYYSTPAYYVLFITILWYYLYSGTKYSLKRFAFFIVSAIANYSIYKLTTTRLPFYVYLGMLLLIIIFDYLKAIKYTKVNSIIGTLMYPLTFIISICLPFIYLSNSILIKLDVLLNGRFYFSKMGFDRYKVNLFGNLIITDAGGLDENWQNTYFYIDSGYVYLLLGYGVIICAIVLFAYMMCSRYAAAHKNIKFFIWCILVCVFAFVNNPLTDIILNPLLFATIPVFHEMRKKQRQRKAMCKKRCSIDQSNAVSEK